MSIFSHVKAKRPQTNTFDLSHQKKLSCQMGQLVPVLVEECVPGDTWRFGSAQLLRFAPMIAPVMHQVNVYMHAFFVPNRILWDNWENFITGGPEGTSMPAMPVGSIGSGTGIPVGSLGDYMGLPTGVALHATRNSDFNALPFAGYSKIYNEYYRDENLVDEVPFDSLSDGNNSGLVGTLVGLPPLMRAWQHDYFTSALPWTQKGPEATIPLLGGDLSVTTALRGNVGDRELLRSQRLRDLPTGNTNPGPQTSNTGFWLNGDGNMAQRNAGGTTGGETYFDPGDSLIVSGDDVVAATINELRRAFRLQEWLEKNARGGSRYKESILSHFGVKSDDYRLQRPEFIGGYRSPVTISEVLQTSDAAAGETPQGNMAGHGVAAGSSKQMKYFVREHGYLFVIMSVMPKATYQQGIRKHFLKRDKFDYFWPSFAHLGEQAIENREIYVDDEGDDNIATFGYTPRYAEYKYIPSTVHGEFRESLDFWHMGRKFATRPALNADFISMDFREVSRVFAVTDEDVEKLYVHVHHYIKARRPMPYYGTPTI